MLVVGGGGEDNGGAGDLGGWRSAFRPTTVLVWMVMVILCSARRAPLLTRWQVAVLHLEVLHLEVLRTHTTTRHTIHTDNPCPATDRDTTHKSTG